MSSKAVPVVAVLISVLIVTAGTCMVDESSADTGTREYKYGNHFSMDLSNIDTFLEELTGKTLTELVEMYLSDKLPGYTITTAPYAKSEFALTRNTGGDDRELIITDYLTGYFELRLAIDGNGPFPEEGTYEAKSGESGRDLFYRIFNESTAPETDKSLFIELKLYIDATSVSYIDLETGKLTRTDASVRVKLLENERHDIFVTPEEDDDGKIVALTVDHDDVSVSNDIYLHLKFSITSDNLQVLSDEDSWTMDPVLNMHIDSAVISTDLADSLGKRALDSMAENGESIKLPELVLKLLENRGRNIDLVETIYSLTSSELSDISFLLHTTAGPITDARGYEYTNIVSVDAPEKSVRLSEGAYTADFTRIVKLMPDYILNTEEKAALIVTLTVAGWNDIDVMDLSSDSGTIRASCNRIYTYVDSAIAEDEGEEYSIATGYKIVAVAGIAISIILPILIWRRII